MPNTSPKSMFQSKPVYLAYGLMILIGLAAFVIGLAGTDSRRVWQAYLINFLLFSAISQGALVFSALMQVVKARWCGPLKGMSESFAAFFPVSLILFILLFLGYEHLFPWVGLNLHGKEVWLNIPFLFARDFAGLIVLYGVGSLYIYFAWRLRHGQASAESALRYHTLTNRLAVLYLLAFVVVASLIGYDLIMSMDPHWYSTLFGAYTFAKAFYLGLAALIIMAAVLHLNPNIDLKVTSAQFHDMGKLLFAFCLVWADFFYCQFVVIWYGNISEETAYVITRTMRAPWNGLAWLVFSVCFILPFFILLNKRIKTRPKFMGLLAAMIILGFWLEHFLLIAPAIYPRATVLPLGLMEGLIFLGFCGMMLLAISLFMAFFPRTLQTDAQGVR